MKLESGFLNRPAFNCFMADSTRPALSAPDQLQAIVGDRHEKPNDRHVMQEKGRRRSLEIPKVEAHLHEQF
jgi:hypothetical protein